MKGVLKINSKKIHPTDQISDGKGIIVKLATNFRSSIPRSHGSRSGRSIITGKTRQTKITNLSIWKILFPWQLRHCSVLNLDGESF